MIKWNSYIKDILNKNTDLDRITLSVPQKLEKIIIPPIIKASIVMLDSILNSQNKNNIFVFPERKQSAFLFALYKAIHNITTNRIHILYDPTKFIKGQKLKYKNCVMEFDRIETYKDSQHNMQRERIWVKFSNMSYGLPLEFAPYLQLAETHRLSKYEAFAEKYTLSESKSDYDSSNNIVERLKNHKTHLSDSIFYVSSLIRAKENFLNSKINFEPVKDVLFLGQVSQDGDIKNLSAGQHSGNHAIVLAPDLYAVTIAIEKGAAIQSLIIEISSSEFVGSQLDVIDKLTRMSFPIIFVTNVVNSLNLNILIERGYNTWRWNEKSITNELYSIDNWIPNKQAANCANKKIEYLNCSDDKISNAMYQLYRYHIQIKEKSAALNNIYEQLFALAFIALRQAVPLAISDTTKIIGLIEQCENDLLKEKVFIASETYNDFISIIENFKIIFSPDYMFPKVQLLQKIIHERNFKNIYIVIPDKINKDLYYEHLRNFNNGYKINTLYVLNPSEYQNIKDFSCDVTIIVGWLNRKNMERILFSYNTPEYIVLLYDYEKKWKQPSVKNWCSELNKSNNQKIVRDALSRKGYEISVDGFKNITDHIESVSETDEVEEIELLLREIKYRKYTAKTEMTGVKDHVDAIPVNFSGDYLGFYKKGHTVITVTSIINDDGDQIQEKKPESLKPGEFIIIREAQKDIIREIADIILNNSNKSDLRPLATKWKDALKIEELFSTHDEIIRKIIQAGSNRNKTTILSWLTDEERIAPRNEDDIMAIARATGDSVLLEQVNEIYEAGQEVRRAHVMAGRLLSERLKANISYELQSSSIDPESMTGPVDINIENIGIVKVLKVESVDSAITVDISDINRLIKG